MEEQTSRFAVVHFAEISLKGRNRPFFERMLVHNITRRLRGYGLQRVERLSGRMLVHLAQPLAEAGWAKLLGSVFGIANWALAYLTEPDMEAMRATIVEHLPDQPVETFRVHASRDDKSFPLTSPEIGRELGATVYQRTGWPVRLKGAELIVEVEVLRDRAIVSLGRHAGLGGLPVGASGRVVLLLSGGIDSPAAGYLALKRGCRVIPVHLHSRPFGNWLGSEARAREIVRAMQRYGLESSFYAVPIGRQQREITVRAPVAYRVILYRRLMVRVAQALAYRERAKALYTGESLGQVASQTLESLAVIQQAVDMPILRPLIGMDKVEIVDLAARIGTLELSQLEGDDCCQFLMPRRVITRPQLAEVQQAEAALEMARMVQEALEQARLVEIEE